MLPSTVWLSTIFKISSFCVQQKKEIHTGLEKLSNWQFKILVL